MTIELTLMVKSTSQKESLEEYIIAYSSISVFKYNFVSTYIIICHTFWYEIHICVCHISQSNRIVSSYSNNIVAIMTRALHHICTVYYKLFIITDVNNILCYWSQGKWRIPAALNAKS